jgi:hypothetical protein
MPKNYPALLVPEILPQDPSFACISTYKLWKDSVAPEIIRKLASTPDFHLTICAPTSTLCFQGLQYNFNIRKNKLAAELDKSSIITMDELWKYNNLMYQQSHEPRKMEIYSNWVVHNTVSGFGIVVKLQNNGSLIINHQTYFVELSREEMDLLYIEQDESVGRYEKFDKSFCMILHEISNNKTIIKYVHGMTQYIARIFMYNGSRLIKMFDPQKRIDASLFSKASAVEYVFKRQDLKAERDAARILREKRRKDSKSINEMIAGKAKSYMEKARVILRHEQKHHEDRMEPLSNLLLIDKKINRLLSGYIIDNETDILRLYDMQDKRQKTVTTALSTLKLLPNPVMTKEDFQTMVRIDPNIVKDEELRNKVIELLKQRREILISLWEVFQCENQDGTLKILEDETAERDHEFVAQFGDLLETYERDSSNGRQVARKGLLLIRAYEYYMKFDLILEPVLNPEIIRLLFLLYPDRSKEVEKLIYQDFVHRYGDATNANVCFISPIRTVTQVDFCSEIEYCNFRREVDKLQILSCKEYYTRMLKVASEWCKQVNTLKREEYRMQYEYQVPTLAEEILSYSSELDGRELRNIYAHVADPEHHSKRIAMAPDFFVEELPTLWKEKKLKRNYAGETKGTSKFDFRLKTLDELFDFHRWTPAEKEKYRKCHNYNGDNQQIKDYSEFREAFDLLTTTIARINEYERNIEKCYCDISKHEKIGRALEASSLRADLELYISGYDNNIKEQNRLIELIMNLAFTQNRMLCVFRNSDKLDTMMTFLESFEPTPGFTENDQSLIIEKLVGFVLFKIRDETQRQLLRTTNAKLTWNPQIFAIKQNLAIQGKCGEESMELSLESLATAPAFNPMYAATKQSNPRTAQIVSEHPHTLPIGTIENGQQKRL